MIGSCVATIDRPTCPVGIVTADNGATVTVLLEGLRKSMDFDRSDLVVIRATGEAA